MWSNDYKNRRKKCHENENLATFNIYNTPIQ